MIVSFFFVLARFAQIQCLFAAFFPFQSGHSVVLRYLFFRLRFISNSGQFCLLQFGLSPLRSAFAFRLLLTFGHSSVFSANCLLIIEFLELDCELLDQILELEADLYLLLAQPIPSSVSNSHPLGKFFLLLVFLAFAELFLEGFELAFRLFFASFEQFDEREVVLELDGVVDNFQQSAAESLCPPGHIMVNWYYAQVQSIDIFLARMEAAKQLDKLKMSQFINYPNCPWWALKQFLGRPVSVVGKVVFIEPGYIILQLDPREKKELKVNIEPYQFRYCFSDKQFSRLKASNNYNELRSLLEPNTTVVNQPMSWMQEEEAGEEAGEEEEKKEEQPWKAVNVQTFKLGSVVEIRGTCTQPNCIKLEQFTPMDKDLDLARYNRMLEVITERMPDLYY